MKHRVNPIRNAAIGLAGACVFTLLSMTVFGPAARADYIILRDGRTIYGDVVSTSSSSVRFRYVQDGIEATVSFPFSNIIQWDYDDATKIGAPMNRERTEPAEEKKKEEAIAEHAPKAVVIPLRGQVGGLSNGTVRDTFDAEVVRACLERAVKENAQVVILDINSPGGLVAEMELICEALLEYRDKLRIVAFPEDAFSAAAIISLCCKEMVVRPESRIGAAVIIRQDRNGVNAVEAKFASVHHARQRQYMEKVGRPYDVVAAMTIQETELWWSPEKGFTMVKPDTTESWELVDQKSTILTLTAAEALRFGVALHEAPNTRTVLSRLEIDPNLPLVSYADEIFRYSNDLDRRLTDLRENFTMYLGGLSAIVDGMNAYIEAAKQRDKRAADRIKTEINRSRGLVMNVGRRLQRSDRSILARRVEVPDEIIKRLEEDAELLGRLRVLLDEEKIDSFNEAAKRINTVVKAWQDLLR